MKEESYLEERGARQRWLVTVKVDGHPDWPVMVTASRERMAETMAMMGYPYPLGGQFVDYTVERAIRGILKQ